MNFGRRNFLIGCGGTVAAALTSNALAPVAGAWETRSPDSSGDYHLRPHYREQPPLDPILAKIDAALDNFPLENDHDRMAATLAQWSSDLRESPRRIESVVRSLADDFRAVSLRAQATKDLRSSGWLKVQQLRFNADFAVGGESFGSELIEYLQEFDKILAAEFQITAIERAGEGQWNTRVRYQLVGSGANFYREQRSGTWELGWQATSAGQYKITRWRPGNETRSRSTERVYEDLTGAAFGRNRSYSEQLGHGVDYWRTVLDEACRIDVYGHNGLSVGDIDGDEWDDVYVCQPAGLPNRLFRNRRDGTFEDVTEGSGVGILENTASALFADFRNSGVQDLLVVRADGPVMFLNDGKGRFQEKRDAFQFAQTPQGTFTGAAAADYDRDGWLDVYFCLYVYYQGTNQYKYPTPYYDANNGPPNFLMRNERDGTFRDATAQAGLNQNNTRYSFCCGWTDVNGDGWPDLYVVNDFGKKNLYLNKGDGTFTDIAAEAGVEDPGAGMSVSVVDFDNDGKQDFYIADMWTAAGQRIAAEKIFQQEQPEAVRALYRKHAMGNSLFRNRGGVFQEVTSTSGASMGRWSWSSDAWDFDHDGFADLYVANGMISGPLREDLNSFFWRQVVAKSPAEAKSSQEYEQGWSAVNELIRADYSWSGYERNVFLANNGDGTFSDVSGAVGLDFIEDARAFALADLDHDGRLEVLLKNRSAPQLRLLKNVVSELPSSISFRLRGTKSNRDAIGATITVEAGGKQQMRMLQAGSGFLSQHSRELFFGLGFAGGEIRASVRWPSGLVQHIEKVPLKSRIWIEEGRDGFRSELFTKPANLPGTVAGKSESLPEQFETWLLEPVPAPDFSLLSLDGRTHTLSALRDTCVLLHLCAIGLEGRDNSLETLEKFRGAWAVRGLQLLAINLNDGPIGLRDRPFSFPVLLGTDDVAAIYNILYRAMFDRHRDLSFPSSLLLNPAGMIVKIYGGALNPDHVAADFQNIPRTVRQRISRALPFGANEATFSFGRNYLSLGSAYFQRGYFDEAGTWFSFAVKDDPSSAEAHYGIGSVFLKQGKNAEAQISFEQATKVEAAYPDTKPNAWNNLGLLAAQENRTKDAIGFFSEALRWNPEYVVALQNLGNAYRQAKDWDDAQNALEHALRLKPDDAEVNYSLGMVFAQKDQPERAHVQLQRALQLRPNYPEAINNLGVLYLRTKRRNEAVAEFEKCILVAPAFDQSYLNLARVYAIEGERDKARATLLALLQQHPNHPQAFSMLEELKP